MPDLAGIALDFVRHDESVDAARRAPGFFTVLVHEGARLVGYSVWRVVEHALYVWPQRHWGTCRHMARRGVECAMEEGRRRGALVLIDITWLTPAVVRRLTGLPMEHVREVVARG